MLPVNQRIWRLFQLMLPGLFNGMGGVDYTAIEVTFNMEKVDERSRSHLFSQIVRLIEVIKTEQRKKNES